MSNRTVINFQVVSFIFVKVGGQKLKIADQEHHFASCDGSTLGIFLITFFNLSQSQAFLEKEKKKKA